MQDTRQGDGPLIGDFTPCTIGSQRDVHAKVLRESIHTNVIQITPFFLLAGMYDTPAWEDGIKMLSEALAVNTVALRLIFRGGLSLSPRFLLHLGA